jgi:hypothetical protein
MQATINLGGERLTVLNSRVGKRIQFELWGREWEAVVYSQVVSHGMFGDVERLGVFVVDAAFSDFTGCGQKWRVDASEVVEIAA